MLLEVVSRGRVPVAVLAALALAAIAPSGAQAAGGCDEPGARVFSPWGDPALYVPAPDGGFEDGASGWTLSDGATVQDGNEPFQVGAAGDQRSLSLPAGSAATTPPICIDVAHPTIRLFARNTGAPLSSLHVSVIYRGLLGIRLSLLVGTLGADGEWQPSQPVPVLVNLLSLLNGDQDVEFRFTPAGDAGEWSIDDVYVDPYSKG